MFKRVLVPLDGSQMAEAVLPAVRAFALQAGAEVVVLQVTTPIPIWYYGDYIAADSIVTMNQHAIAEAKSYVQHTAAHFIDRGIKAQGVVASGGDVPEAILNYANENSIDLVAISTHGRGGLKRSLLGSVADRVLHGAIAPVLLVRPDLSNYV